MRIHINFLVCPIRPAILHDAPINAVIRAYELWMEGEAHHTEIELLQDWQHADFHLA